MRTWQTIRTAALSRHTHARRYAALVLSGGYEEAGDLGRFRVETGDVIFHDLYEAHLDRFPDTGAEVLNLPLEADCSCAPGPARVADPDLIMSVAERSPRDAVTLLLSMATNWQPQPMDWRDQLASELIMNPSLQLTPWAEENGLRPWTVSRGFAQVFNVSPEAFRARAR